MLRMRARWSIAAVLLIAGSAAAGNGTLTPEMVVDLEEVGQLAVDAGGKRIAYTLEVPRAPSDEPGRSYVELWVVAATGGSPRAFVAGSERVSAPAWSPDGNWIGFLSDRKVDGEEEDRRRLWIIPADGGEARRLFEHPSSIASYAWSPDGRYIAFTAGDAETDEEKEDKKAGRDWVVADEDPHYQRLWLFDTESGESRLWFDSDLDVASFHWTPDSRSMIFQSARSPRIDDEYMFSSIQRVAVDGKAATVVTETAGKLGAMATSPGGETLAFLAAVTRNDPLAQSLFVVPAAGGKARNLTEGYEGTGHDLAWLDAENLLLVAVERERHVLYQVEARDGERRSLPWPGMILGHVVATPGTKRLAISAESPAHPTELFTLEPGGEPVRLTRHSSPIAGVRLARQEVVEWKGADDWSISGVLTYPIDYESGKRYPLVLQVHGGPEGVSLDGWTTSSGYPVQLLAARGYMVLQPNYRGSQGRGVAFSKADHDDLGGKEFEDVLAGIDALIERGLVDGSRVGTGGWSYGGYMSAWAATRHSERFRASIVAAGLTNWVAFAGTTDIPYEMSLVHWDSWWFDEPELHWERSPLAHIKRAATPTLLIHGAKDDRVHPEQSLELYTALRVRGVPTRYVLYPREPHGLNERAHRLDFIERTLDWFDTHLAPPGTAAGAGD